VEERGEEGEERLVISLQPAWVYEPKIYVRGINDHI
jgi:hypothetical protein